MNRLGLLNPLTLSRRHMTDTRDLYDKFSEYTDAHAGQTYTAKLPSTDALVGPFGIFLYTPALGRAYLDLTLALDELTSLTPREREVAIIIVGICEHSEYQLYAHERVAAQSGLTDAEVQALRAGAFPPTCNEKERVAYGIARELSNSSGPLSADAWQAAQRYLGLDATIALVHIIAYHRYVATILRAFDAQVPVESERVETVRS